MLKTRVDYDEDNLQVIRVLNTDSGEELTFFSQGTIDVKDMSRVYDQINAYQATLSQEDSDKLFKLFKSVEDGLDNGMTSTETLMRLKKKVKEAAKIFGFKRFMEWFRNNHDGMFFADTIKDEFVEHPDKKLTKEKTYLKHEYIDFIAMLFFIRAMLPLYVEFMLYLIKSDNKQKSLNILRLFLGSEMDFEDGPLDKLRSFIDITHTDNVSGQYKEGMFIGLGLSDDDCVDYLCSIALINRLLMYDPFESKSNPPTFIYNMVVRKEGGCRTSETMGIRSKFTASTPVDEEYSKFESYRKITDLSMGDEVYIQTRLKDFRISFDGIEFDDDFYREELKHIGQQMQHPIERVRLNMLGWLLKDSCNPRALEIIDNRRVAELLLVVKTALKDTEHSYIGMFLTSTCVRDASIINSNISSNSSMPKRLIEEIDSMFTYSIIDGKMTTVAKEISENSRLMKNMTWQPHGQLDYRYVNEAGYLTAPNDIYERMVSFVKFILTHSSVSN